MEEGKPPPISPIPRLCLRDSFGLSGSLLNISIPSYLYRRAKIKLLICFCNKFTHLHRYFKIYRSNNISSCLERKKFLCSCNLMPSIRVDAHQHFGTTCCLIFSFSPWRLNITYLRNIESFKITKDHIFSRYSKFYQSDCYLYSTQERELGTEIRMS